MLNKNHEKQQSINLWKDFKFRAINHWIRKRAGELLNFMGDTCEILCLVASILFLLISIWLIAFLIFSL